MTRPPLLAHPARDAIALLPPFERLPLARIQVLRSAEQVERALHKLSGAGFVGFDTETKPVFRKDVQGDGPHVIQLATLEEAFIVQVNAAAPLAFLREVLESPRLIKVGFGISSDRGPLQHKLGIRLDGAVELAQAVKRLGYQQAVGLKAAVAIVLGQRLQKSRKATTSNWAQAQLTPNQLQYAADDAHAALMVFHALGCLLPEGGTGQTDPGVAS